jgi:hypothetical protein
MPRFAPCTGVRPGTGSVAFRERDRYGRGVLVPVGDGDRAEDDIPARVRVSELAPQPSGRHRGVCVRGSQPDRGRIGAGRQPQQFSHPGRPRGTDPAGPDADYPGSSGPGHFGRPVAAPIGHHQQLDRHVQRAGGPPQRGQTGGQQRLLVVCRHDHAGRRDRSGPAASARPRGPRRTSTQPPLRRHARSPAGYYNGRARRPVAPEMFVNSTSSVSLAAMPVAGHEPETGDRSRVLTANSRFPSGAPAVTSASVQECAPEQYCLVPSSRQP